MDYNRVYGPFVLTMAIKSRRSRAVSLPSASAPRKRQEVAPRSRPCSQGWEWGMMGSGEQAAWRDGRRTPPRLEHHSCHGRHVRSFHLCLVYHKPSPGGNHLAVAALAALIPRVVWSRRRRCDTGDYLSQRRDRAAVFLPRRQKSSGFICIVKLSFSNGASSGWMSTLSDSDAVEIIASLRAPTLISVAIDLTSVCV